MSIIIKVNPVIEPEELYRFYVENNICEKGYGIEAVARPLKNNSLIVAAYDGDKLIGIADALFNGVEAVVMEFCLAVKLQGEETELNNGSLMEKDNHSVGKMMGDVLITQLNKMGASFISAVVYEKLEKSFYESIGFKRNDGHINYVIDTRPYIK
jgi:hypothetical protein